MVQRHRVHTSSLGSAPSRDSQNPLTRRSLKISSDVGTETGCMDMPPYVTRLPDGLQSGNRVSIGSQCCSCCMMTAGPLIPQCMPTQRA